MTTVFTKNGIYIYNKEKRLEQMEKIVKVIPTANI